MATPSESVNRSVWPTFFFTLIAFCVFGALIVIAVRYYGQFERYPEQRAKQRLADLAELRKLEQAQLDSLEWIDKEKKIVRVPIRDAMALAVAKLQGKKPQKSAVAVQGRGDTPSVEAPPGPGETEKGLRQPPGGQPAVTEGDQPAEQTAEEEDGPLAIPGYDPETQDAGLRTGPGETDEEDLKAVRQPGGPDEEQEKEPAAGAAVPGVVHGAQPAPEPSERVVPPVPPANGAETREPVNPEDPSLADPMTRLEAKTPPQEADVDPAQPEEADADQPENQPAGEEPAEQPTGEATDGEPAGEAIELRATPDIPGAAPEPAPEPAEPEQEEAFEPL